MIHHSQTAMQANINCMPVSSRKILFPRKSEKIISVWWLLVGFAVLLGILLFSKAGKLILTWLAVWIALSLIVMSLEKRRVRKIAEQRQKDSICTFAKSFNCRVIDTRIIRATHEELQSYYSSDVQNFPVRATDSFEKDLRLDDENLDDMAIEIARRAQRSFENTKQNPLYGKVKTVGDLVLFLNHQPPQQESLK